MGPVKPGESFELNPQSNERRALLYTFKSNLISSIPKVVFKP